MTDDQLRAELARMRAELQASELRFRTTFDDAPTGVLVSDLQRRMVRVNAALCAMLGYREDELVGRTLADITHPDDLAADIEGARAMLTGETPVYRTLKRYRHRDGHLVHAQLWVSLVCDEDGAPQHFTAHVVDVSAAHAATETAHEAQRLLDESQSVAQVGSWSYAIEADEFTWSDGQFHLHGIEPQPGPLRYAWFLGLLPQEDRAGASARDAARRAANESFEAEYRVIHPDGSEHILHTRGELLAPDPLRGLPERVAGITRDVTCERATLRAKRSVEQRHRRLLSSLPDTMVALCDSELRCVLVQGGLVAELQIEREEVEGRRLSDFLAPELVDVIEPNLAVALDGATGSFELHDAGRTFQVQTAPYLDEHDQVTGALSVWRDVTARVSHEREIRMLATMVQQSEDAIIAKDPGGCVIEWNAGAERLYGYTREEMLGRPIAVIIPSERDGEDRELLAEALAGRTAQRDTIRRRKDSSRVNVSISVSPLYDAAEVVIGALVIARDITPRMQELAARREIEDRLRVTVDHAPIGVALVDLRQDSRGALHSANAPFSALLGAPDPVAGGVSLTSALHPEDVAALRSDLTLLSCDAQARTETEVRCLRPDGTTVWLGLYGAAVPSVTGAPRMAVIHALDIGERKRFEGRLQHLADHDALTGLYNRRRFEVELARAASHVRRYRRSGALLLLDLDGFKRVNDTLGHSRGDELITRIGTALRAEVRETDIIGRLGGDEFALILPAASEREAVVVGEKLVETIERHGVVLSPEQTLAVTASIGIAPMRPGRRLDAEDLLADADAAMYAAKAAGRNRVAVAPCEDGQPPSARPSWQARLRAAIDHERLELFAQPIRGICAEGVDRYELLLRIRGDDGELVPASTFLPGAERHDLIQRIDRWVFGQALELLAAHEAAGTPVALSVNMSGKTLCDAGILEDLVAMLHARPVPAGRLTVEVTETAAIVNIERAREVAHTLRAHGCRFALDDFGAGFASFYYLKHLEFDDVKIDGEFVKALSTNPTDQLLVRSVVELARSLGAETIAEFVGDDDAITRLRELGVGYGQGFHLGRPAPVGEILPTTTPQPGLSSTGRGAPMQ